MGLDGPGATTMFYLRVSMLNLALCNHSGYGVEEHHENLQELKVTGYLKCVAHSILLVIKSNSAG